MTIYKQIVRLGMALFWIAFCSQSAFSQSEAGKLTPRILEKRGDAGVRYSGDGGMSWYNMHSADAERPMAQPPGKLLKGLKIREFRANGLVRHSANGGMSWRIVRDAARTAERQRNSIPPGVEIKWEESYESKDFPASFNGRLLAETSDNALVVVGEIKSGFSAAILKVSKDGEYKWEYTVNKHHGDIQDTAIRSYKGVLHETTEGDIQFAGYIAPFGSVVPIEFLYLLRLNGEGNFVAEYFDTEADAILQNPVLTLTSAFEFVSAGAITKVGADDEVYLAKNGIDASHLWKKIVDTSGDEFRPASAVAETRDGGYMTVGTNTTRTEVGEPSTVWLIKTDTGGNKIREQDYPYNVQRLPAAIVELADGAYVISGVERDVRSGDTARAFVLKVDREGKVVWDKTFRYADDQFTYANALSMLAGGDFLIAGSTLLNSNGNTDFYVLKVDANGEKVWDMSWGSVAGEVLWDVFEDADGALFLTGAQGSELYLAELSQRPVSVGDKVATRPGGFSVFPNPAASLIRIEYDVPFAQHVRLSILDELGIERAVLLDTEQGGGKAVAEYNTRTLPPGVYFCRLEAGTYTGIKKLVIVR